MTLPAAIQKNTVAAAFASASAALRDAGVESPEIVAGWLLAETAGFPRLQWPLHRERILTEAERMIFNERLARALRHEPLAYVLGYTSFMGHRIGCDPRALTPRPETEGLVERVLADDRLWNRPCPVWVEVGTGSGCIAIVLALARPGCDWTAVDIDSAALALAQENARRLGLPDEGRFRVGNLLSGFPDASVDGVIANLPYVRTDAWAELPESVRQFEPVRALDGGADGLDLIRRLIEQASLTLKPGGALYLEIGETQGIAVRAALTEAGYGDVEICPDLNGRDRIALGRRPV